MGDTSIQWTDKTWNPTRGCSLASPGCQNCYAMKQAHRFSGDGKPFEGLTRLGKHGPTWTGDVRFAPKMLDAPMHWRKPQKVFVNSMSDLFHEGFSNEQIAAAFGVMAACPQHTFQILTKRSARLPEWFAWLSRYAEANNTSEVGVCLHYAQKLCAHPKLRDTQPILEQPWPLPSVWLGVSVENQKYAEERVPHLVATPAAVRFVSAEPLLGPVDLNHAAWCEGRPLLPLNMQARQVTPAGAATWKEGFTPLRALDWAIVGGESGPGARPFDIAWARSIRDQCAAAGVACFIKQLGAHPIEEGRRLKLQDRHGGDMGEWPEDLRVREFPAAANA